MTNYIPRCAGIVGRCAVCQKLVSLGQVTAFQKWTNGKLEQVYKCHECVKKEKES
jgi:hypothetical protein